MSDDIIFNRQPPGETGPIERITPRLRRIVAPNAGPFTFTGTCSYIVGEKRLAIVDPGPDEPAHIERLIAAVRGETVEAVLITHTHRDHCGAAPAIAAATAAKTYGGGRHRVARPLRTGDAALLDASADRSFVPDVELRDGDAVSGPGWRLTALATPGHCANHLAFVLAEDAALLSGDHVMAWSTSIVAPPDGAMSDYMASLARLLGRPESVYFPGHGGAVAQPQRYVRALIRHRRMREAAILASLAAGDAAIPAIVARVYDGLAPALRAAAALNTLAHLEDLVARGIVTTAGETAIDGVYSLV
jgi:glyoxylase-like metal-dependent hydrolase (beta-lactamase superfamily II)